LTEGGDKGRYVPRVAPSSHDFNIHVQKAEEEQEDRREIKRLFSCVIRPRSRGRPCLIGGGCGAFMYSRLKSGTGCWKSRPIFNSQNLKMGYVSFVNERLSLCVGGNRKTL
jgi:hypothetical protein